MFIPEKLLFGLVLFGVSWLIDHLGYAEQEKTFMILFFGGLSLIYIILTVIYKCIHVGESGVFKTCIIVWICICMRVALLIGSSWFFVKVYPEISFMKAFQLVVLGAIISRLGITYADKFKKS